jgi:hypothetical protein
MAPFSVDQYKFEEFYRFTVDLTIFGFSRASNVQRFAIDASEPTIY